jgi:hypothetical protein
VQKLLNDAPANCSSDTIPIPRPNTHANSASDRFTLAGSDISTLTSSTHAFSYCCGYWHPNTSSINNGTDSSTDIISTNS